MSILYNKSLSFIFAYVHMAYNKYSKHKLKNFRKETKYMPDMVVYTFDHSTQEAEASESL